MMGKRALCVGLAALRIKVQPCAEKIYSMRVLCLLMLEIRKSLRVFGAGPHLGPFTITGRRACSLGSERVNPPISVLTKVSHRSRTPFIGFRACRSSSVPLASHLAGNAQALARFAVTASLGATDHAGLIRPIGQAAAKIRGQVHFPRSDFGRPCGPTCIDRCMNVSIRWRNRPLPPMHVLPSARGAVRRYRVVRRAPLIRPSATFSPRCGEKELIPDGRVRPTKKPKHALRLFLSSSGGAEGDRTPDLHDANVALSQLSYRPTR